MNTPTTSNSENAPKRISDTGKRPGSVDVRPSSKSVTKKSTRAQSPTRAQTQAKQGMKKSTRAQSSASPMQSPAQAKSNSTKLPKTNATSTATSEPQTTGKQLRRMSRAELIEVIYALEQDNQALRKDNKKLQAELDDKDIRIATSGSIAEAALSLNHIFEDAQAAADQYLNSIKRAHVSADAMAATVSASSTAKTSAPTVSAVPASAPRGRHAL